MARRTAGGPSSKRIIVGYGFWIFLLSDIIMFSAFFATYAVLVGADGGRTERAGPVRSAQRRDRDGLPAALELHLRPREHRRPDASRLLVLWRDGGDLRPGRGVSRPRGARIRRTWSRAGPGPTRSAFLSAFFTLVGCHGLHVTAGLLWLLTMMAQVFAKGYRRGHPAARALLQPVLARAGHHLGRAVHRGVFDGSRAMSHAERDQRPA